jgi:hypothetical protein
MRLIWTNTASYVDQLAQLERGVVPVITPPSEALAQRWKQVLQWYGLEPGDESTDPPAARLALSDDWIISLDAELSPIARAYAAARGRRFLCCADSFDSAAFERAHDPTSLWIFGLPVRVHTGQLRSWSGALHCPWGVATAPDLPTLSLGLAKASVAIEAWPSSSTNIDVLRQRLERRTTASSDVLSLSFDAQTLCAMLQSEPHRVLSVSAHGEGSHLYLVHAILCGLVHDQERDLSGQPIDGCRLTNEHHHCKRAPNAEKTCQRVGDLRAIDLALITCNGFSVAGQQYPSSSSSVFSALAGYPRGILTTNNLVPVKGWLGRMITGLGHDGVPLGTICRLGNEVYQKQLGEKPLVLLGDPAPGSPALELSVVGQSLPLGAETSMRVFVVPSSLPEVVLPEPACCELVRAERTLLVIPHDGPLPDALLLQDAGPRLSQAKAELMRWSSRLDSADQLERTIACYFAREGASEEVAQSLRTLMDKRAQIGVYIQAALTLAEEVGRTGVWTDSLEGVLLALPQHVANWDQQLALLLRDHLLLGGLESLLLSGLELELYEPGEACQRCGIALNGVTGRHWARSLPPRSKLSCPCCDFVYAPATGAARPAVHLPAELKRGAPCNVTVSWPSAGETGPGACRRFFAAVLVDKGRGEKILQQAGEVAEGSLRLEFCLPHSLTANLHTFELAWVEQLDVSFIRLRSVGVAQRL